MKGRFKLDPNLSAKENLWNAARLATVLVMKRNHWYGLDDESRQELFDEIMVNAVVDFMYHKIRLHKYNREFSFLQNVISSAWSASSSTASRFFKHVVEKRHSSYSIDYYMPGSTISIGGSLSNEDRPVYVDLKKYKGRSYEERPPHLRANIVKQEYKNYIDECNELGATPLKFQPWLTATGYGEDYAMLFFLMSRQEQRETRRDEKEKEREELKRKEKEEKQRAKLQKKLDKAVSRFVLPDGWEYVERDGILCIRRKL